MICSVTPNQLYENLLDPADVPAAVAAQTRAYRYGNGDMQIHLALSEPPRWRAHGMEKVAITHITSGVNAVSRSINEANRGLLPGEATIVVGQPAALDPSRVPDGKGLLWIQLQECPRRIKGDAAGQIEAPDEGAWTESVREAYADRIIDRLGGLHSEPEREYYRENRAVPGGPGGDKRQPGGRRPLRRRLFPGSVLPVAAPAVIEKP